MSDTKFFQEDLRETYPRIFNRLRVKNSLEKCLKSLFQISGEGAVEVCCQILLSLSFSFFLFLDNCSDFSL